MNYDFLIVGAGFSGAVVAEQLANAGLKILIIDKREHLAGNAYDEVDQHGIKIHKYGPHIFHTNSERIFNYLSNFTDWRKYEHRVLSNINGELYEFPINQNTINKLFNLNLDENGIKVYFESVIEKRSIVNSEDVCLNSVGHDLYEMFFKNYTLKQWGLHPSQLSASVAARIPTRTNKDDRYFTDKFQYMPADGYTSLFKSMLNHPNITIQLGIDYFKDIKTMHADNIVYTGPIDQFYNYCYGHLPYRSLQFAHEYFEDLTQYQAVGTVNYPNEHKYTRITEFKHLTGQTISGTSIIKEFPCDTGEPYYPIPRKENAALYKQYEELSEKETSIFFVGRLAQYKYYNMDQAVGAALALSKKILNKNDH
jgi:UDP-galactopyranose mutase